MNKLWYAILYCTSLSRLHAPLVQKERVDVTALRVSLFPPQVIVLPLTNLPFVIWRSAAAESAFWQVATFADEGEISCLHVPFSHLAPLRRYSFPNHSLIKRSLSPPHPQVRARAQARTHAHTHTRARMRMRAATFIRLAKWIITRKGKSEEESVFSAGTIWSG